MYNYCNQVNILKNKKIIFYTIKTLANYGFSALGELQGEYLNLEKTIKVIYELIQQRQRDLEFRNEIIDKMAKLESDKNNYNQTINRLKLELENQKKSNGQLENTNKLTEKKTRNEKDKLLYEKDELQKQIFRLNSKETQMLHEIRKKENEINKLKEQVKILIIFF